MSKVVTPYQSNQSKKEQVASMFNKIAGKYDFLNHFLSMGIDKKWRKKAIQILQAYKPQYLLDIATGTGDFAVEAVKLNPVKITGVDISEEMLKVGQRKISDLGLSEIITLEIGDSENLKYADNSFQAATVAFGVRNFENLDKGLTEICRVLSPGAPLMVLEFSKPGNPVFKLFYNFYLFVLLPVLGKIFSKEKRAYTYLPESINVFPHGRDFMNHMEKSGFNAVLIKPLSFGIVTLYMGTKRVE